MENEFLEGYDGQSVAELINLESTHRVDSLVLAFEEAIQNKVDAKGLESVSVVEYTVLLVEALEREVNNGGYTLFFSNTPHYAPEIVAGLRRIGCETTATITQDAIDTLGLSIVSAASVEAAINAQLDEESEEFEEALSECDDRFYDYEDQIDELLFAYIKENASEITI